MANVSLKTDFKDGEKLFGQQLNNNFVVIKAALETMNKIVWQDDPDDSVTAFRGTTEEINQRDIIDGQLLYDTSTGETYIDVGSQRISTGSGNSIHIGSDTPTNPATQLWVDPNEPLQLIGTEVTNSMEGTESNKAPSVQAVKNYIDNIYSTDEVKTNMTWIDGKPIYRKVVQINSLPNNTETTYQTGIINGETIKYDGFLSLSESDLGLQHMPYFSPYSSTGNVYYWVRKDATYIHIKTGADRSSSSAYIIIEYTKTTD